MGGKRVVIVGGGAAGLSAAYELQKRGFEPLVLEADSRAGGRLRSDPVDGFSIDTGADFFCSSYDVTLKICEELHLPLARREMRLGWYRRGGWVTTTPGLSMGNLLRNLPAARSLGLLSPRGRFAGQRLFLSLFRQSQYLGFHSESRLAELDDGESFGDYLKKLNIAPDLKRTIEGFLEITMGHVEFCGQAYMRSYLWEMFLNAHKILAPEKGAGMLAEALVASCSNAIRVSTPVKRLVIRDGVVTGVAIDGDTIETDAVICATLPAGVLEIIPEMPRSVKATLESITYSSGCRVVIGLDHPPLPPGWYGALYPDDETPLLLDRSVSLPSCTPPGKSTLDLIVGQARAAQLIPLDDAEIKRQLLSDARRNPPPGSALPRDEEGLFTRVYRWQDAVCMSPPGMFTRVAEARRQLSRAASNLFLAGDYTRVPSVNGALASGVGAAREAADLLGD